MQLHQKCTEEAARALGIAVRPREARQRDEFEGVFAVLARERPDALVTFTDAVIYANRERIIESTAKQRLPAMYEFKEFVVRGGLMAYGPSLSQLCECGATRVDKILKGAKPADLPVDLPTKFELVINLIWKDRRQAVA